MRGLVAQRDDVFNIRGDDSAGDGGEHVFHKVFQLGDLVERSLYGSEQPGIFQRYGGLIRKPGEQGSVALGEEPFAHLVVGVDHAGQLTFHLKGDTQNRPQVVGDHTLLSPKSRIFRGVSCQDRLPTFQHTIDQRSADLVVILVQRFLFPIPGYFVFQLAGLVVEHEKGALGTGEPNDGVDHLTENGCEI